MNIERTMLLAALALGLACAARAQSAQGDLVLGFVPNGTLSQGTTTDLEVDLGSVSGFLKGAVAPGTYDVANLGNDLASTYGVTWASSTLSFGVVGAETGSQISGPTAKTVWASASETSGFPTSGFLNSSNNNTSIIPITAMYGGLTGSFGGTGTTTLADLTGQTDAVNLSALQGFTVSATTGGSWTVEQGQSNFEIAGASGRLLTAVNSGNAADLEQVKPGSGNISSPLGYFTLVTSGADAGELEFVVPAAPPPGTGSRLINISTRAPVGAGGEVEIAGFVITGTTPKTVLIRANGPALSGFGVTGVLEDPVLTLFDSNKAQVATNTQWGTAADSSDIAATASVAGAFAWTPGSADSAILVTLQPGPYTAQVSSASQTTGVALVEVYDADTTTTDSKLINISTRSSVGTGANIQIAGFYISGSQPETVLIRASGPALSGFGVSGVLPDPSIQLVDGNGDSLGSNTAWGTAGNSADLATAAASSGAFPWASGSADSAILITLQPGAYTAKVSGASGDAGVALVEVYDADL